ASVNSVAGRPFRSTLGKTRVRVKPLDPNRLLAQMFRPRTLSANARLAWIRARPTRSWGSSRDRTPAVGQGQAPGCSRGRAAHHAEAVQHPHQLSQSYRAQEDESHQKAD